MQERSPLPDRVEERCGFVLYPYVSWAFAEAITWSIHAEALEELRGGADHPEREKVLELSRLAMAHEAAWRNSADSERNWVAVSAFLRDREFAKIRQALAELDEWLLAGK
jgi:hypothetical protein